MLSLEKYACESMATIEVSNSVTINLSYQIASKDWHLAEFFLTLFSLAGGDKVASFDSFETQANATKLCDFVNFVNFVYLGKFVSRHCSSNLFRLQFFGLTVEI